MSSYFPQIKYFMSKIDKWDDAKPSKWNDAFSLVHIQSSVNRYRQPAYFVPSPSGIPKPLLLSLHTWSGDYSQFDPLAEMALNADWNYIHPDFRGPNWTKEACLNNQVISDIDDAIQFAIDNGSVDTANIFVAGASGGGHATLGSYLNLSHSVKAFLAWVPISDLIAWYHQSKCRNTKYAQDILKCTSDGSVLNEDEARRRSPLYWEPPLEPRGRLEIFAGINDGYTGSVPISQSILFFNKLVEHYGYTECKVGENDMIKLLTRGFETPGTPKKLGDRLVIYEKVTEPVSLIIFDGTHEMLPEYCFSRMQHLAEQGAAVGANSAALDSPR